MSSKSPGQCYHQPQISPSKQLSAGFVGPPDGTMSSCPGEFLNVHHHHNAATTPDGDLSVVTRTFSGLSDCSGSGMSSRDSGYGVSASDGASTCSSSTTDAAEGEAGTLLVLEPKSLRSFTTNDEYLYAMKEDLADWFVCLYKLDITADNFFPLLETGVLLCQHANKVQEFSQQRREQGETLAMRSYFIRNVPQGNVQYRENVKPQTFQARDNVSNFIKWGRQLGIPEVLSFETDDLVLRKNEKNVILCLLEIARVGAKLGMLAPTLVQMEEEIDAELAGEEVKPKAQIKTCDMKSLDEMVRDLVGRCTCPVQFPMVKVGDGKYKIGDSRSLIFVRILRNHVMVRVGGGWDTLENYLNKHDPCQCNYRGHRAASTGPGSGPKSSGSAHQRQQTSNSPSPAAQKPPTAVNSGNKSNQSPRRMSTPTSGAVSAAVTQNARNRSSSPKQPIRSKSPTLIISRHVQGKQQKPSFSVDAPTPGMSCPGSPARQTTPTNASNGSSSLEVSKSWSQTSSKIPTFGSGESRSHRSKSPSPCPASKPSRLRSPSPLNSTITESNTNQLQRQAVLANASNTCIIPSKGTAPPGVGGGGEVKVGTPRSIKRASMNRVLEVPE